MSNKVFWTMRNGEQIDIDKMSVSHLRNALKMVVRMHQEQQSQKEEQEDDWYQREIVNGIYSHIDPNEFYD